MRADRLPLGRLRRLGAIGLAGLAAFAVAYLVTNEPAPEIRVLWRSGIEAEWRAELERRFLLVNPQLFEGRLSYDILDTRRENLEALVKENDVLDTDRVSRESFTVPVVTPSNVIRMWVAHRTPEVAGAKTLIEHRLGRGVSSFSYPYGRHDSRVRRAVRGARYRLACTSRYGTNLAGAPSDAVRRIEVAGADDLVDFRWKLAGKYDWVGYWQGLKSTA